MTSSLDATSSSSVSNNNNNVATPKVISPKEFAAAIKAKYIDKTRRQAKNEAQGISSACVNGSRICFMSAGVAAGAAAGLKIAAVTAASIAGVGLMTTPLGWAVLGLVVVALVILAARHVYLKSQGMETDTKDEIIKGIGLMATTFSFTMATVATAFTGHFGYAFIPMLAGTLLHYKSLGGGEEVTTPEKSQLITNENSKNIKHMRIYKDDKITLETNDNDKLLESVEEGEGIKDKEESATLQKGNYKFTTSTNDDWYRTLRKIDSTYQAKEDIKTKLDKCAPGNKHNKLEKKLETLEKEYNEVIDKAKTFNWKYDPTNNRKYLPEYQYDDDDD